MAAADAVRQRLRQRRHRGARQVRGDSQRSATRLSRGFEGRGMRLAACGLTNQRLRAPGVGFGRQERRHTVCERFY